MSQLNLTPRLGERGIFVGRTGSGKTTSAVHVLRAMGRLHRVVIIDSKGDEILEKVTDRIETDPRRALRMDDSVIYRPETVDNQADRLDAFLMALYNQRESLVVYLDEVNQIAPSPIPPLGLDNLLRRGRLRKVRGERAPIRVSTLMATQRPSRIPVSCFTESEHFYIHRLMRRDRAKLAEEIQSDRVVDDPVRGHEFYYWSVNLEEPIKLVMPKPK